MKGGRQDVLSLCLKMTCQTSMQLNQLLQFLSDIFVLMLHIFYRSPRGYGSHLELVFKLGDLTDVVLVVFLQNLE